MGNENYEKEAKRQFKEKFWELYRDSNCTSITQFAKMLDMNRQSIDRYYNGERLPDLPSIYQICKKMDVSADWLMGISDVKKPSSDLKGVVEYTGLSESAVNNLYNLVHTRHFDNALSDLITNVGFYQLITEYDDLIKLGEKWREKLPHMNYVESEHSADISDDGSITMNIHDALFHYINKVSATMRTMCEDRIYAPPGQRSAAWMTIDTEKEE